MQLSDPATQLTIDESGIRLLVLLFLSIPGLLLLRSHYRSRLLPTKSRWISPLSLASLSYLCFLALGAWPAQLAPDYSASRYTIIEVNLALALVALLWSIRVRQYRASVLAAASVLGAWCYALVVSSIV